MSKQRVAVVIQSSRGFSRSQLTGIGSFARAHRGWSIFHDDRMLVDSIPDWLKDWQGDGMIASFDSDELVQYCHSRNLPAVDLQCERTLPDIPSIRPDDSAAVNVAYQHLRDLGFTRIAYCGFRGTRYSDSRERHLVARCAHDKIPLAVLDCPFPHVVPTSVFESDGLLDQEALVTWLKTLELPVGIIACNDIRGSQVLNAARACEISVPDQIAIVGMDNDICVCGLCDPALTSVDLNTVHIGFRAAECLDGLMSGAQPSFNVQTVEPAGIVVRESTDLFSVDDEDVAQALRYIADNWSSGITVDSVVSQAAISRSTLERRFTSRVGRTIKAEINRVRISHLKQLLVSTSYPMEKIAQMVGFSHAEYMITFFKKTVGITPGEYRKEQRVLEQNP